MLRERANAVIKTQSATDFIPRLNVMAAERELQWYKGNKDVSRSIRKWLAGEIYVYYWVLDVIELVVMEMEQQKRNAERRAAGTNLIGGTVLGAEPQPEPRPEPTRTIEAGTVAELDALREIVFLFHPLSPEARQRTLRYLESL